MSYLPLGTPWQAASLHQHRREVAVAQLLHQVAGVSRPRPLGAAAGDAAGKNLSFVEIIHARDAARCC